MRIVWLVVLALALLGAAPPPGPTIKAVTVEPGIVLHYVDQGHGAPVIFVHGSLSDGGYWSDQVPAFAKRYHVIAYSRRYDFPNTNPARAHYSAIVDADDLSRLITRLHLGKAFIVGHSYGALTALFLATRHPEQVRKLVLAEPPAISLLNELPPAEAAKGHALYGDIYRRMVRPMQSEFRQGKSEAGVATFIDYVLDDPHAWAKFSPASKRATMRNALEWDVMMTEGTLFPRIDPRAVARIHVPVLIMSGGRSYRFLGVIDRELARLIRGSEHLVLPNDGHQMWYEEPVACRRAVEEFLAR